MLLTCPPTATTVALVMLNYMTWLKNISAIPTPTDTPILEPIWDQHFKEIFKKERNSYFWRVSLEGSISRVLREFYIATYDAVPALNIEETLQLWLSTLMFSKALNSTIFLQHCDYYTTLILTSFFLQNGTEKQAGANP